MAEDQGAKGIGRLSAESQASLLAYARVVLDIHNRSSEARTKMERIDIAYARYKEAIENQETNGVDIRMGDEACGINNDDIIVPIVVSQVDSFVGYLNDTFISGYPIFPVVPTPDTIMQAEKLQAIIDDHATRGRYQRQLAKDFKDAIKYNLGAIEVDWCPLDLYSIVSAITEPTRQRIESASLYINKLRSIDKYNLILDNRVDPVDVPMHGEYAGYLEIISRIELKRRLAYAASTGSGYNTSQAMTTKLGSPNSGPSAIYGYFTEKPQISELITAKGMRNAQISDWEQYLTEAQRKRGTRVADMSDVYEYLTLYARIIPDEHGITNATKKGTPQIWKLCFVNHEKLVYAARVFTIYDTIPIYISQPYEDGFSYQTKSPAENAIPFQEGNSKLFSIRLNAARRAIVDRAIYDQTVLSPNDVNSPHAAAKIPMKANSMLGTKTLDQVYKSIPFDSRGTETVVQDMQMMSQMADEMNGVNKPQRGQFQKGNKSRKEWEDTMAGSYGRMRNCALMIEYQQLLSVKEQIKMNIFHKGASGTYQNQMSGANYDIKPEDIEALRRSVNNFKLADGLLPAEKIASTETIVQGLQMLSTSQPLQMQLGAMLPKMFLYLLNVGGVQNLEQFMPTQQTQQAPQP